MLSEQNFLPVIIIFTECFLRHNSAHFEIFVQKIKGKFIRQFTRHCIVYVVLNTLGCLWTLNATLYCVFRIPNVLLWHLNNLIARNQHNFWKTYENIYTFFCHSHNLLAWSQYNFWKTYKKMFISVSDFYMKIINNKHTLLYNLPTIYWKQRYKGLCELTTYFAWFTRSNPFNIVSKISSCHSLVQGLTFIFRN